MFGCRFVTGRPLALFCGHSLIQTPDALRKFFLLYAHCSRLQTKIPVNRNRQSLQHSPSNRDLSPYPAGPLLLLMNDTASPFRRLQWDLSEDAGFESLFLRSFAFNAGEE
jgi:hypothetical protein